MSACPPSALTRPDCKGGSRMSRSKFSARGAFTFAVFTAFAGFASTDAVANAPSPQTPSLPAAADLGPVQTLSVAAAGESGKIAAIRGQDAQGQLIVTAKYGSGAERDLTRQVKYAAAPANIVKI